MDDCAAAPDPPTTSIAMKARPTALLKKVITSDDKGKEQASAPELSRIGLFRKPVNGLRPPPCDV
jgi:hypothetical protein